MQACLPQERSFGNMLAMGKKFHRRMVRERLELEKLFNLEPKLCIVSVKSMAHLTMANTRLVNKSLRPRLKKREMACWQTKISGKANCVLSLGVS
jgi:hypothetical protein